MTHDVLLDLYAGSLRFTEGAMADVPDARLAEQPGGLRNHPAWTLTHMCVANDFCLEAVGRKALCPPGWAKVAAPGTQPVADRAVYPPLTELLDTLRRQHAAVTEGVRAAPPGHFEQPAPEQVRKFAATLGHIVAYMLAAHEQYHLAQVLAWKRAAGLKA
jgi:uncharacterized damage-inducible protein DinB